MNKDMVMSDDSRYGHGEDGRVRHGELVIIEWSDLALICNFEFGHMQCFDHTERLIGWIQGRNC